MKKPLRGIDNNRIFIPNQRLFLHEFVKSDLRDVFRLTGGTALSAFYLEHRLSEDLDFFSNDSVPLSVIESFLKSVDSVKEISFSKLFDRNIFELMMTDRSLLKLEFTQTTLINIEDYALIDNLRIDSFLDIVVNKLCAIADRYDAKDYVDVYCALNNSDLNLKDLFVLAEKKCNIKGIRHVLKSRLLQIPDGIQKLPLKFELTETDLKIFFEKLIRNIIASEKL